ncbi:MAG: glycosyltransferase family 4 protein [Cytophagaceae bacterium]|nr:glycosyltransferase family 4 protein [Cytophagaceae bacterium]
MNVLITSYYYKPHIGGVENSITQLSAAFARKGHQVTILCSDADLTKKKRLALNFIQEGGVQGYRFYRFIPFSTLFTVFAPFVDILRATRAIKKLHQQYSFDLVLTRNHIMGLAADRAGLATSFFLIPSIVQELDKLSQKSFSNLNFKNTLLLYFINGLINPVNQFLQKRYLQKTSTICVFSSNLKQQLISYMPELTNKTIIIPPGVDTKASIIPHSKSRMPFVFLIVGRLIHAKRVDLAIQAMSKLQDQKCILKVVGEGPVRQALENLSDIFGLKERIIFYDFTEDVASFYQEANCFLMTSEYETFGQTIIEAMSFGLPVIAFKSDGRNVKTSSAEIIEQDQNGYFCDFTSDDLYNTMLLIMQKTDQELMKLAIQNNFKVKAKYSWDRYVDDFLERYNKNSDAKI